MAFVELVSFYLKIRARTWARNENHSGVDLTVEIFATRNEITIVVKKTRGTAETSAEMGDYVALIAFS